MWIIWMYFFLFSSGALGEEELDAYELFCNSYHGFKKESVEEPTRGFKFLYYERAHKLSRNSTIDLPCLFQNLNRNDIVWKKGEKVICDEDNFICKTNSGPKDKSKYSLACDALICHLSDEPGQHLVLRNVQHEDAGEYICEVKSSPPKVLSKIKLEVVDTEFLTVNQTFTVAEGGEITLPCEVKDIGDEYLPKWVFNNDTHHLILYDGFELPYVQTTIKLVKGGRYDLHLHNITQFMAGDHSCVLDTTPPKLLTHKLIVKKVTPEQNGLKPMFPIGASQ